MSKTDSYFTHYCCLFFFSLLLSTCVPAAIKDPGGSNQGITRMAESVYFQNSEYLLLHVYLCVSEHKLGGELRMCFKLFILNPEFEFE